MALTNFPRGISSFGVPVVGSAALPMTTGRYIFVSSSTGSSGNDGLSAERPINSLANALLVATAGNFDVIVLMPAHAETISSATSLTLSVSGVQIVGLGTGALRPTLTFSTAATATVNVTAANVTIQNVLHIANYADVAAAYTTTTAKNFQLIDCEFRDTSSVLNFVTVVDTNATTNDTDGLTILRCTRIGAGATNATTIVKMDGTNDRLTIAGCYFAHAATTGAGLMPIATGKVVTNARISNNTCNFVGATGLTTGTLITTDGSTNSGVIEFNRVFDLDATSEILVTASSGFHFFENYSSAVADASGYILPARDS